MLYGEGHKAFYRLQLEIIKHRNEHTIFAWNSHNLNSQLYSTTILAPSPAAFECSAHFLPVTSHRPAATLTYEMTNNGLRLNLPCVAISQERMIAIFDCENERSNRLGVWLERSEGNSFRRLPGSDISHMKTRDLDDAEFQEFYVEAIAQVPENKHQVKHMLEFEDQLWGCNMSIVKHKVAHLTKRVYLVEGEFVAILLRTHGGPSGDGLWVYCDSFVLIVGMCKDYPTLSTVRLPFSVHSRATLEYTWARIQHKLALESSHHVCDYHRVALCCGNVLDVALRKTKGADHVCWKVGIRIEDSTGDVVREFTDSPPSTCSGMIFSGVPQMDPGYALYTLEREN